MNKNENEAGIEPHLAGRPTTLAGIRFLELLGGDEMAFDNLYCVAFQMMDAQWLAKCASYMEFNVTCSHPNSFGTMHLNFFKFGPLKMVS